LVIASEADSFSLFSQICCIGRVLTVRRSESARE
jgi:hypothetical protein